MEVHRLRADVKWAALPLCVARGLGGSWPYCLDALSYSVPSLPRNTRCIFPVAHLPVLWPRLQALYLSERTHQVPPREERGQFQLLPVQLHLCLQDPAGTPHDIAQVRKRASEWEKQGLPPSPSWGALGQAAPGALTGHAGKLPCAQSYRHERVVSEFSSQVRPCHPNLFCINHNKYPSESERPQGMF